MHRKIKICFLLFLMVGVYIGVIWADEIQTAATVYKGKIVGVDANSVKIETPNGVTAVARSQILKVSIDMPQAIERGFTAFEKGNMIEAKVSLAKAIDYMGLDVEWVVKAILCLARAHFAANEIEAAEKIYKAFLVSYADTPFDESAKLGLIEIAVARKQYDEAIPQLEQIVAPFDNLVKPSSDQIGVAAHAYLALAKCYEAKEDIKRALDAYFKVIALYPEPSSYPEAAFRAAVVLANSGKKEKALKLLTDVIENYPTSDFAKQAIDLQNKIGTKDGKVSTNKTGS